MSPLSSLLSPFWRRAKTKNKNNNKKKTFSAKTIWRIESRSPASALSSRTGVDGVYFSPDRFPSVSVSQAGSLLLCAPPLPFSLFLFVTHWDINTRSLSLPLSTSPLSCNSSPPCSRVCVCVCVCVCERRERERERERERGRGRERIGYHLQYKRNEKGVFPWGLIHLPQITLHFLIQPLTFWPSWEAVVSQWRPNRRVAPPPLFSSSTPLSSSPPPLLPGSPLTAKRCERDCSGPSPSIIVDHTNPISYY